MTGQVFGMVLTPIRERTLVVPAGYEQFRLWLGDWSETFLSSVAVWSPSDYGSHWRAAAAVCGGGEPSLFCAEMQEAGPLDIWVGLPDRDDVWFYNRLTPRRELVIDGYRLRPSSGSVVQRFGAPSADMSCWRVDRATVTAAGVARS